MKIQLAKSSDDIDKLLPVLLQLRTSFTSQTLLAQVQRQMADGFKLVCLIDSGTVVCVAGFVIVEKLGWGKTLYIDDLVTDTNSRSKGAGKQMMDWIKDYARETDCGQVHLDSGLARLDTHRFYEREGFTKASYHFSIRDLGN